MVAPGCLQGLIPTSSFPGARSFASQCFVVVAFARGLSSLTFFAYRLTTCFRLELRTRSLDLPRLSRPGCWDTRMCPLLRALSLKADTLGHAGVLFYFLTAWPPRHGTAQQAPTPGQAPQPEPCSVSTHSSKGRRRVGRPGCLSGDPHWTHAGQQYRWS